MNNNNFIGNLQYNLIQINKRIVEVLAKFTYLKQTQSLKKKHKTIEMPLSPSRE